MTVMYVLREGELHETESRIHGAFSTLAKAIEYADKACPDHTQWDDDPVERCTTAAVSGGRLLAPGGLGLEYEPRFIEIQEVVFEPTQPLEFGR